jgi:RNA polymerase sigma-70 factor (ECF subfamily)
MDVTGPMPDAGRLLVAADPDGGRRTVPDPPREVVVRAQGRDDGAFGALYAHYHAPIRRYLHRLFGDPDDAEELAQDTFLKAYRALPATSADLRVGAWLYRIATNVALDAFRHRALVRWEPFDRAFAGAPALPRQPGLPGRGEDGPRSMWVRRHGHKLIDQDRHQNPEPAALGNELAARVRAVLAGLPPRNRLCLELQMYHDLSYDEIGEVVGMTRSAVRALLFRSRAEFRRIWTALDPQPEARVPRRTAPVCGTGGRRARPGGRGPPAVAPPDERGRPTGPHPADGRPLQRQRPAHETEPSDHSARSG